MRSVIVIMLLLLSKLGASAQTPAGIAYYDVDRLYDTIPSLFYDDRAYTPEGTYGWDTERYRRKIRQVAETVDSMALPVVALYGVETEQVARDIAARCVEDYACLHRTLSSRNGLDLHCGTGATGYLSVRSRAASTICPSTAHWTGGRCCWF